MPEIRCLAGVALAKLNDEDRGTVESWFQRGASAEWVQRQLRSYYSEEELGYFCGKTLFKDHVGGRCMCMCGTLFCGAKVGESNGT